VRVYVFVCGVYVSVLCVRVVVCVCQSGVGGFVCVVCMVCVCVCGM